MEKYKKMRNILIISIIIQNPKHQQQPRRHLVWMTLFYLKTFMDDIYIDSMPLEGMDDIEMTEEKSSNGSKGSKLSHDDDEESLNAFNSQGEESGNEG